MSGKDPPGGPRPRSMNISYIETTNELKTLHNQLLVLFMQASPLLGSLVKQEDEDYSRHLAEYFDSSANAHWAVLFPKTHKVVKEPLVTESAKFKKVSTNLGNLSHQVQSIRSQLLNLSPPAQSHATAATKLAILKPTLPPKPTPPKTPLPWPRLVIWFTLNTLYTSKQPVAILRDLNKGLEKLGHMVRLSEVHQPTKGNLIITPVPDVSAEQLASVSMALVTVVAPFSKHPVMVYQDIKWSKLLLHNVQTSQTDRHPAFSPDDIH
jgi:hypothetical protein